MKRKKVVNIRLRIVRGKPPGPSEKRLQYSTLIEYVLESEDEGANLIMGITPPTYFFLKSVLKQEITDLERVIYHNIRTDTRKIFQELFFENNLLNINLKKRLDDSIDEVVIDKLKEIGPNAGYNFSASIYLSNGQRIPNIIPSDAIVFAILANKDIFVSEGVLTEKARLDEELTAKMASKKRPETEGADTEKKPQFPKRIYT
jgi:hypothetical protein